MKISALLNRKRTKARDIYDVIFLFGKTEPDYGYLQTKLNIENKNMLKKRLSDKRHEFDLKRLSKEIEPFLIKKKETAKVELFDEFLKSL
jgi:hypothetical protein